MSNCTEQNLTGFKKKIVLMLMKKHFFYKIWSLLSSVSVKSCEKSS